MAIIPPPSNWKDIALGRDEKLWSYLMIVMLLMMAIMTVGFVYVGDQNPPEAYAEVEVGDFLQYAIDGNEESGLQKANISEKPATSLLEGADEEGNGGDIYMMAQKWNWTVPLSNNYFAQGIQITEGETYKLHLGSVDVLHNFQLIGSDFLISIQVVPGYDYIVDFIPNETGTFRIICTEYCGAGHHEMMGFLEVVPA